jgi:phosphatidylglycerol:prolipoprotein diacylglycerol transferase
MHSLPTLAAWLHDWGSFLIELGGGMGVRWYGLAYAAGFVLGWLWLRWMSRRGMTPLTPVQISDAMLALVLGVVLGGRLGYVIFYEPRLLMTFSPDIPWWGLLQLNRGGMSSHGGILGVILASGWVARKTTAPWLHVLDLTALACTPGLFLGRIANFINGELLGMIVAAPGQPAPWWAVRFPQERFSGHEPPLTSGQAEKLFVLIDSFRVGDEPDGAAYERVLRALQAGGARARQVAADLEPLLAARHPSQLYQAAADGLALVLALWLLWCRPRKPGVVGCWFMILYGVMRILTELIRLPDPELALVKARTGLSTGQWLSVGMIVVGAVALPLVARRAVPRMGGWCSPGKKPADKG